MADPAEHREAEENVPAEEENAPAEEEDNGAQIAPIIMLEEVDVLNGEEDEDALLDLKAKLYRFDKDGNQWKERGAGTVKFLKHKVSGKVRLVMRQSKTLKICANHLVRANMTVQEHAGNEKSCVWHATDFADEELKDEMFCIRFASVEKPSWRCLNRLLNLKKKSSAETKEMAEATDLLGKLKVEVKTAEKNKAQKEEAVPAAESEKVEADTKAKEEDKPAAA